MSIETFDFPELQCNDPKAVRRAYLQLSLKHHPDHGGDPATFAALHIRYKACLERARRTPCLVCDGKGMVHEQRIGSFKVDKKHCEACNGTGRKYNEDSKEAGE